MFRRTAIRPLIVSCVLTVALPCRGALLRAPGQPPASGLTAIGTSRFFELVNGPATPLITLSSAQGSQTAGVIVRVVVVVNGNPTTNTGDEPLGGLDAPCTEGGCGLGSGLYDFHVPQELLDGCAADPNACSDGLKLDLGQCDDAGGCAYDSWRQALEGGCGELGNGILPDGGCDLLDPSGPAESILDELATAPPFNIRYRYGGDDYWLEYQPGNDGKLYVQDGNQYADPFNVYQLESLFQRFPNGGSVTIVQDGREFTVVKAPDGTRQDGFDVQFLVHHPDGFTYNVGRSYAVVVSSVNTISDGLDWDDATYAVRPLPDGTYRVIDSFNGSVHDDPDKLADLFSQLPAGTDSISLIEGGTTYTVRRPAGVPGTVESGELGVATAALFADHGYTRTGPRSVEVTDTSHGPKIGDNSFLETLFKDTPGADTFTVVENGRTFLVTDLGDDATVGGRPVRFLVTHPDGFNFTTGPNANWNGLGPKDIYTGSGADSRFIVRPTPGGTYTVINNTTGAPLSSNDEALSVIFSRLDGGVNSIVLVENGSETTVSRPGTLDVSFEVSHTAHADREYVRFALGENDKLIVLEDGQVNYSFAAQTSLILGPLFDHYPRRDTLTIVQDGREYTAVKAPPGTRTASGLRVEFVIHHPDGFTFTAGRGYVSGFSSPDDIYETGDDEDSRFAVRPLPDGTYRVLYNDTGGPLSGNPDALRVIFGEVPSGTDSITLIEDGSPSPASRPAGTRGTNPGTAALDRLGAALGGNTIDFSQGGKTVASAEITGPSGATVVSNQLSTRLPAVTESGFLDGVFARFPGANALTIVEGGRSYFVTRTRGGLNADGVSIPYIINHPDGFNFTAGPNHWWTGLAPDGKPANGPIAGSGSTPASAPPTGDTPAALPISSAGGKPRAIIRQADGSYTLQVGDDSTPAPPVSYPVTVRTDELGNRIFDLPGETFVDAAPGVEVVNIAESTDDFALTAEAIQEILFSAANSAKSRGPSLAAFAVGQGVSTGDGAFDMTFVNNGKPRVVQGDVAVLKPTDDPEPPDGLPALARLMLPAAGTRALLAMAAPFPAARLLPAAAAGGTSQQADWLDLLAQAKLRLEDQVTPLSAAAYCLQKDMAVPRQGQIYTLADAAAQQRFDPARQIISATSRVQARGELHPDSDATAYFHSTRQWAVWSHEKGFDEDAFTDAFVELARQNFTAGGQAWTDQIEQRVRELGPNRYHDIHAVLLEAGLGVR